MESYSFKSVEFTYPEGEKKALRNITFTVQQGDFLILWGLQNIPNLLRLLSLGEFR